MVMGLQILLHREEKRKGLEKWENISDTAGVQKYMKISSLSLSTTCNIYLCMTFAFPTALHHHHHDGNHLSFSSYVVLVVCLVSLSRLSPPRQPKRNPWQESAMIMIISIVTFSREMNSQVFLTFRYFFLPFTSYNQKNQKQLNLEVEREGLFTIFLGDKSQTEECLQRSRHNK